MALHSEARATSTACWRRSDLLSGADPDRRAAGIPHTQYRAALLTLSVSSIIGLATQHLVADVRHQAEEARRETHAAQVNDVVRGLYNSSQARTDVCEAAKTIGEASRPSSSSLSAGPDDALDRDRRPGRRAIEIPREPSAVSEAFISGKPNLVREDVEDAASAASSCGAAGSPHAGAL